jgi:dihydrofolate reductase
VGRVLYSASISLDGFAAGPDQGPDHPLGVGGDRLHDWVRELAVWRAQHGLEGGVENESTDVYDGDDNEGALVMGRGMFGGGPGPWDPAWRGWWGEDPPFHLPVFVLTHHARDPLEMEGGTTFSFVTDGIGAALDAARAAAGGRDVAICGGATTAGQYLAAGLVDEVTLHVVPALLGDGVRLFTPELASVRLEQVRVVEAPGVAHLTYRVLR